MKIKSQLPIFILYFFCSISCENVPGIEIPEDIAAMENVAVFSGKEAPRGTVSFERIAAFGDTEEFYFAHMGVITVDDENRVYLADAREGRIHIFYGDGSYIRSLGGKGGGPGEFQSIHSMEVDHSFLYVMDIIQRRLTAFYLDDLSLAFTLYPGSDQDGMDGNPVDFAVLSEGNFLVFHRSVEPEGDAVWQKDYASVVDRNGKVLKPNIFSFKSSERTILQTDQGIVNITFPFICRPVIHTGPNHKLYYGFNDRIFIQVFDMDGKYERAIYYGQPNVPLNRQYYLDRYRHNELIYEAILRFEMPAQMHAFSGIIVDDNNRIWINIINEDHDTAEWWILDDDGSRLAVFETEARNIFQFVKNGYVYVIEDDENNARMMVKYRIGFRYDE